MIKSPAGEFPIEIAKFETEDGYLVMVGEMGGWEVGGDITPGEMLGGLGHVLSPVG